MFIQRISRRIVRSERCQPFVRRIYACFRETIGVHDAMTGVEKWFSKKILLVASLNCLFILFSIVTANIEWMAFGLICSTLIIMISLKRLEKDRFERQRKMLLELPVWLNHLLIRLMSGDHLQQALMQTVHHRHNLLLSPLQSSLAIHLSHLRNNQSLYYVLEQWHRTCKLSELSQVITTLLMYHQNGGEHILYSLREQVLTLWQKRKQLAKQLGEEASAKLVFPMVIIFFVMVVLVATPAIMTFQS